MEKKIKKLMDAESVIVKDMSGEGGRCVWCINVVSAAFKGISSAIWQRMVYKSIWEELHNVVHGVYQMITTPPLDV